MAKVTIQPSGIQFEVNMGETILAAAQRHGIDFPFRCRQGVCTACVCKTIEGEADYGDRNVATLMLGDENQKFTYACIGYAKEDLILHHPFIKQS